jgi:hypothetical protein
MNWIIEKFKQILVSLGQWQTWAVIVLLGFFGTLAWNIGRMALWTDTIVVRARGPARACRQLNNGMILGLFFGMIFVVFFAVLSMGEVQRYIELTRRGATWEARRALLQGIGWGVLTAIIAFIGLYFFSTTCR